MHPVSDGVNDSITLDKDEVVLVLGHDDNGKTEVRKGNGEEGMVPNSCIQRRRYPKCMHTMVVL